MYFVENLHKLQRFPKYSSSYETNKWVNLTPEIGPHSCIYRVRYGTICIDNLTIWLLNDAVPSSDVNMKLFYFFTSQRQFLFLIMELLLLLLLFR
jgi:hypothetical protein